MARTPTPPDPDDLAAPPGLVNAAKEALRERLAALRRAVPAAARAERAARACARLRALPEWDGARVIAAYAPMRYELDVGAAVRAAGAAGAVVCLPRVVPGTAELTLHVHGPGDALEESGFMVPEPREQAPRVEPASVDLVLVPGLAFDERGHRLGFGKGFYDRFLPRLTGALRVGVGFDFQLLAEVPALAHDARLDRVVTDARMVRCGG